VHYSVLSIGGLDLAKKKAEKPKRELTKHQLSRWQQQERRRRLIFGVGILVVVAVLGVIAGGVYNGWYVTDYKPLHETVIEVNGTKFNMDYYVKMLQYYGMDKSMDEVVGMTDKVAEVIERNELMKQEAYKMGYSVSDRDVELALASSNYPLKKDYWDVVRAGMIGQLLADDYFDKQVPTQAEQRQIMAMFLESEAQVNEVKARLEAGEDFGQLASELSLDANTKDKSGDLGLHPQGVLTQSLGTSIIDDYVFSAKVGEVSQPLYDANTEKKVGYWLIKVLEKLESGAPHVHPILFGTKEQAEEIKARVEAGEDYDTLQGEYTLDQANR
jgi:hypothetical protein